MDIKTVIIENMQQKFRYFNLISLLKFKYS